jgi:5'(3')-deoxyribonucleotidase
MSEKEILSRIETLKKYISESSDSDPRDAYEIRHWKMEIADLENALSTIRNKKNSPEPWLRASIEITKPIVLIDMDGVICNFDKRAKELEYRGVKRHSLFRHPEAYKDLEPIEGAIDAWIALQEKYETYILSTPPWSNPDAWAEKRSWVQRYLGDTAKKKLILCHNKGLVKGNFLIDDRIANGVADFEGEHIHFGQNQFQGWKEVLTYLGVK